MTHAVAPEAVDTPAPKPADTPAPKPSSHRRRRWLVAGAVLLLLALGWFVGRPMLLGPVVIGTAVVRQTLIQTLVANGHIETPFRVSVGSQTTGVVARVPVKEGQRVRAGDTLLVLDVEESLALAQQAEAQLAQADAAARRVREVTLPDAMQTLAEAEATLRIAQQTYDRNLTASGFDSRAALDTVQRGLDIARAQVRAATLQVSANRADGSEAAVAESQARAARATRDAARSRLRFRTLLAPRDGVLILRAVEVGDVVQPGTELMVLSPTGDIDIVVQIDEKNYGLLALGQSAVASADAFARETFAARVSFINPGIDLLRAAVEVRLRVPTPPAYLRPDMTISVEIETARRASALIVPAADVHDLATAAPWVLVARSGRARRQAIRVGIVSGGSVEVLDGVDVGDVIVPVSDAGITDGARLRARTAAPVTPASPATPVSPAT